MVGYWSFQACLIAENIDIWNSNKSACIWPVYTQCCGAADLESKWKKDIGSLDTPMFYFPHMEYFIYIFVLFFTTFMFFTTLSDHWASQVQQITLHFSKRDNPRQHISLNVVLCLMWNLQQQLWQVSHFTYFTCKELNEDCLGTNYLVKTYFSTQNDAEKYLPYWLYSLSLISIFLLTLQIVSVGGLTQILYKCKSTNITAHSILNDK